MRHRLLAAAAAALALTGVAQAGEFSAALAGDGLYFFPDPRDTIGIPGGCDPINAPNSTACEFGLVDATWSGSVVVTTAGDEGTFLDASGLESIAFTSNIESFTWNVGDAQVPVPGGPAGPEIWLIGLVPGASVSIGADGRIASFSAVYNTDDATFTFSGLSALGHSANGGENSNGFSVSGPLTPVPEPGAPTLLLAGLAVLATLRSRGASACSAR